MINIHTHYPDTEARCWLQNIHQHFHLSLDYVACSLALHPWYISDDWQIEMQQIKKYAEEKNVLAIGETGLDKLSKVDFQLQKTVFYQHILCANALQKPLIIHCVKAYHEVCELLTFATVPAIFHGFNKSEQLAQQLLAKGYYLSLGLPFFQQHKKHFLSKLPLDKIFFETDNVPNTSVQASYNLAAQQLNMNPKDLIIQIDNNFKNVFHHE